MIWGTRSKIMIWGTRSKIITLVKKLSAEYALKDISKPIGISEYKLIESIPEDLKSNLPTIEEIEKEIEEKMSDK